MRRMIVGMGIILTACSMQPSGEAMKPGLWRFVDEVLEISSEGMSKSYLERLRSKADGTVTERCIRPGRVNSVLSVIDPLQDDAQISGEVLKDGQIDATVTRVDRLLKEEAKITGSYEPEHFIVTSKNSVTGSPNPLANIEFTMRRTGKRIGDCPD